MASNSVRDRRKYNKDMGDALLYPLYRHIGERLPQSLSPNSITIAGAVLGLFGSLTLIFVEASWALLVAPVCYVTYHLCDTLDGYHARKTGRTSTYGDFLDHALDGVVIAGFYLAIIHRFDLFETFYILLLALRAYDSSLFLSALRATGQAYNSVIGPASEVWLLSFGYVLCYLFPSHQGQIVKYGCVIAFCAVAISIVSTLNHTRREVGKRDH